MKRGSFIVTGQGIEFFPLSPDPRSICIKDVAHALSQQCRFGGHTRFFYSVGQHSILVADLLERWNQPREVQLAGLLHDASEGLGLNDLPSPVKYDSDLGMAYRKVEEPLMKAVAERFSFPWPLPECVHTADEIMVMAEARDLMPPHPWIDLAKAAQFHGKVIPVSCSQVESAFLSLYERLAGGGDE